MSEKLSGGPAFPVKITRNTSSDPLATPKEIQCAGMTLRDWFAGQALAGMGTWMPAHSSASLTNPETMGQRAAWAYQQADALLAERKKGGEA